MPNHRPLVSLVLRIFVILAVAVVLQSPLEAQSRSSRRDEPESVRETVDESASADEVTEQSLFGILRRGGLVMIPIIGCSFLTLVFVFERFISLRRGRVIPTPFVKRFLHQLREGKLDKESAL